MRHHAESASNRPHGAHRPANIHRDTNHQPQFHQVLPMFPVFSVTYLPGCARSRDAQRGRHHTPSPKTTRTQPHMLPMHPPSTATGSRPAHVGRAFENESRTVGTITMGPVNAIL